MRSCRISHPVDIKAKLFQPFATSKPDGLGIGLSICRQLVEANGGEIEAADGPEGGTVFTVRLPRFDSNARPPAS